MISLPKARHSILLSAMRIIFRADASKEIGAGHVMRSAVLAEEAVSRGHDCVFIGQISSLEWVHSYIQKIGFSEIYQSENEFVSNNKNDYLVLDSYTLEPSSKFLSKKNWRKILSISDMTTPKYYSDIELNSGLRLKTSLKSERVLLSGLEYSLIRRNIIKSRNSENLALPLKVMIVGGGTDPFNFAEAISKCLFQINRSLEIHVFGNKFISSSGRCKVFNHPFGSDLDLVALEMNLALTTASTSSLEFLAREIPLGVVCAVNNQRQLYEELGESGYAVQLGCLEEGEMWNFSISNLRELIGSAEKRNQLRLLTKGLVDLMGASRVMDELERLS